MPVFHAIVTSRVLEKAIFRIMRALKTTQGPHNNVELRQLEVGAGSRSQL